MRDLGPVVQEVYTAYKGYDFDPIPAPPLDLRPFTMKQRLSLAGINSHYSDNFRPWDLCKKSHDDFLGMRGSKHCLSFEELCTAVQNSPLVHQLRQADEPMPNCNDGKIFSAEDILHGLAS